MTVHHHDPDRIMALAAGTLSDAEARLVAAEVAGCEQCAADLDHQRIAVAALAALADDPAATLTDLESRRLRRSLLEELAPPADAPATAPDVARRRRLSWGPLVAVAAVFLAVVVGGNAIRSLSGDDSDTAADVVAADRSTSDNEPSASTAAPETTGDDAGEAELRQADTATTAAATDVDGLAFAGADTETGQVPVTIDDLTLMWDDVVGGRLPAEESATLGDVPELAAMVAAELAATADVADATDDSCVGAAAAFVSEPAETVVVGTVVLVDLGPTVLTVTVAPDGTARLLVHDGATCAVVTEVAPVEHP